MIRSVWPDKVRLGRTGPPPPEPLRLLLLLLLLLLVPDRGTQSLMVVSLEPVANLPQEDKQHILLKGTQRQVSMGLLGLACRRELTAAACPGSPQHRKRMGQVMYRGPPPAV